MQPAGFGSFVLPESSCLLQDWMDVSSRPFFLSFSHIPNLCGTGGMADRDGCKPEIGWEWGWGQALLGPRGSSWQAHFLLCCFLDSFRLCMVITLLPFSPQVRIDHLGTEQAILLFSHGHHPCPVPHARGHWIPEAGVTGVNTGAWNQIPTSTQL